MQKVGKDMPIFLELWRIAYERNIKSKKYVVHIIFYT